MSVKSTAATLAKYSGPEGFLGVELAEELGLGLQDIDEDVDSSCISHVFFDSTSGETTIDFVSGHSYTWSTLPRGMVEELIAASSPGSFFNSEIRGSYA